MAAMDNFKPGAGGMQLNVAGGGPLGNLGKNFSMNGGAPGAPVMSQAPLPSHNQAQIGQSNAPKGAQPVSLMGAAPVQQQILGQGPKLPMSPQPSGAHLGSGDQNDGEVHTIMVEGLGSNGKKYVAEFDAVFPKGTKVLGVTEKFSG